MKFTIKGALAYPFINFKSFWNILWLLLPIIGWLFFAGYTLQILKAISNRKDKGLPKSNPFLDNFLLGLKYIIFYLPLILVLILANFYNIGLYFLIVILAYLPMPFLVVQFSRDEKFKSLYNYKKGYIILSKNIKKFLLFILFTIAIDLIWVLSSIFIVTIIVTYPALIYGSLYLQAKLFQAAKK